MMTINGRDEAVGRVKKAIAALGAGKMILVRDNEHRENEGDLICAADFATPQNIAFMAVHGRGLVCHAVTGETARRLHLGLMARENTESQATAFTVSVDATEGTTTGISAEDRAKTIATTIDPLSEPQSLRRPGHVFPIIARPGGVFERAGHTEAAVDLSRLAGLTPSGVICEVLNNDGTMARGPELEEMSRHFDLPLISVEDLIIYRDSIGDVSLDAGPTAKMPTSYGLFTIQVYRSSDPAAAEAVLLTSENLDEERVPVPLVRVHSECLTGETLASARCDCGPQLNQAMERISQEGGYLVYLRQEGRGIGLYDKVRAYALQDDGLDTVDANLALGHQADHRRFGTAVAILRAQGVRSIRLMTNNPAKLDAFKHSGIRIVRRDPLIVGWNTHNTQYFETKLTRMGHALEART